MSHSRRKLTAVMFTDIVGYSAMVNRDERQAHMLLEMHRLLLRRQLRRWRGRRIDQIGDGTLAIFDSARDAMECAVSIQHELHRHNYRTPAEQQLRLRIGLHQGDVEHGHDGVFGDGINVCARIEPLAPAGGIAASAMVHAQVHGPLRPHFVSAGVQALKNIQEPLEVYQLAEDGVPAAAAALGPAPSRDWQRIGLATGALALVLGAALGGLAWWKSQAPVIADSSLAVLPLENLATHPGSAELVAGLHDSLITEIARSPHLKVISRSSVMRYTQQRASIPEVARLLRVANVLEGSVQRIGSRLRVNVQLIRADTDEHIWAEIYDRELDDLFDMQTEIAREIARKIQGNLALPAMPASERPTSSAEAYELYLRAISQEESDPALGAVAPDEPLRLLERAVALDPSFALAHAAIARYSAWGARWAAHMDPTRVDSYVMRALQAAQRAMDLKPDLPEALLGMGLARYWKDRDPAIAEPYFVRALEKRPAYSAALYMLSGLYERVGNLDRSVDVVRALLDVDPANEKAHEQLTALLTRLRRYDEAERAYARWLQVSRSRHYVDYQHAQLEFYRSGDLGPWKRIVAQPHAADSGLIRLDFDRWVIALYEGRFDDAAAIAAPLAAEFLRGGNQEYGWASYAGQAMALGGESRRARPYLEAVAAYFRAVLERSPDDYSALGVLAQAQYFLGDRNEARLGVERALQLAAPKAGYGPSAAYYEFLLQRAQLAAWSGQRDVALADLERLLREPSGQHAHAVLRDPYWGPLLQDAEFQTRVRSFLPPPA